MQIKQNLTTANYNSRGTNPTWIVLHYTANDGDTAYNNTSYFKSTNRGASAHYFVDEGDTVWQCVRDTDTAWHVGSDTYKNACRNTNSIGIEMCSRRRSGASSNDLSAYYLKDEMVANAIELTKMLMKKYSIPASRVCRHYDVTGKICPAPMVYNNGSATWTQFLKKLEVEDMTKAETQALIDTAVNPLKTRLDTTEKALEKLTKTYRYIGDVPEWYREAVQYYIDKGVIQGKDDPAKHQGKVFIDLTATECRLLTSMYRAETGKALLEEPNAQ